ncbi:MAG: PilZ domain-containing protein [Alphaproteobacteria bacterium]|nr:PilZ domain-containing protein [Alphaproteobacteria bacterium]
MSALLSEKIELKSEANPLGVVFGRFMLPDMSEHACQVTDLSFDGAIFLTTSVPPIGQAIVAYLEDIGRIEALSGEPRPGGFAIHFTLKGPRLERLQQRIQWLKDRNAGKATDGRRHARYEPTEKASQITLPDGRIYNCEVLDISVSGAGIKTEVIPSIGTSIMLGKMRGRVVRYIDQGVAIEFVKQLDQTQLPPVDGPSRY